LLVWNRIILSDGSSIRIDNAPATNVAGYAGLADKVDVHSWRLLKGVALSTLLGVGTQLTFGTYTGIVNMTPLHGADFGAALCGEEGSPQEPAISAKFRADLPKQPQIVIG
jgi:type IV secretion system protein TrbI